MSHNFFGHLFRFITWGESHGPAIGCVIDGCPPGLALDAARDIQPFLDKRKPGTSKFVTQRQEPDQAEILSGVFEGKTTGTPISIMIRNTDQRSKDYSEISGAYRPGHADYTYDVKYGIRDYRGGGRSSARETASRVAAGAVARLILQDLYPDFSIIGYMTQIGSQEIDFKNFSVEAIAKNPFFCPDRGTVEIWENLLSETRKQGSSVGAIIECKATGIPAGLGAPLYGKLDADLASAMMSINAVKGVEIGAGFASASLTGEENADQMRNGAGGKPRFTSNRAGGILGGISTGDEIIVRFAVKPTSSILTPRQTVTNTGEETEIITKGRHDPCVGIRAVPVGEAMLAIVLADHALRHRGQTGR
jgi:chorismate synthase